ncbi:hypothetical protein LTR85_001328 [Meristemomyces frigidus]|nr:hypothetical protein LTR85_001328 [Meristemomyces frigidus]
MALYVVKEPTSYDPAQPVVDIVAVHDFPRLGPARTRRDDPTWLKDVLGGRFPQARILSFCYDSDPKGPATSTAAGQDPWISSCSDCISLGDDLLFQLLHQRDEQSHNGPILFVSRLLGGLIIKQCLLKSASAAALRSIRDNTVGICFIGLIHNDTREDFGTSLLRCAAIDLGLDYRNKAMMAKLQSKLDMDDMQDISRRFRSLDLPAAVVTIRETKPTLYQIGKWYQSKKTATLTSPELVSADFNLEWTISVNTDYRDLSDFPQRGNIWFDSLMVQINRMYGPPQSTLDPPRDSSSEDRARTNSDPFVILTPYQSISSQDSSTSNSLQEAFLNTFNFSDEALSPALLPCHVMGLRARNPNFVGRTTVIQEMELLLLPSGDPLPQRTYSLLGPGGTGKTQVALEFVSKHLDSFPAILWAHGDTEEKLARSFAEYAQDLGLVKEIGKDLAKPRDLLKRWYATTQEPWLLVFDSIDGPGAMQLLEEYWPSGDSGSVLVITRDEDVKSAFAATGSTLAAFDEEDATYLLRRLLPERLHGTGDEMCRLASWSMINADENAADFLSRKIDDSRNSVEAASGGHHVHSPHDGALAAVWDIEHDDLDDDAASFMGIMAFLDPDGIDESILIAGLPKAMVTFADNEKKYTTCRSNVTRTSLVSRLDSSHLWMHRTVQEDCHKRMTSHQRQQAFDHVVKLLDAMLPAQQWHDRWLPTSWSVVRRYFAHVISLAEHVRIIGYGSLETDHRFAHLLDNAAWYLFEQGTFRDAVRLVGVAEDCALNRVVNADEILANIYHLKGSLAVDRNNAASALENFRKFEMYIRSAFDKQLIRSPDMREQAALGSLGLGLQCLNRFSEAESYYSQSLEAWKKLVLPGRSYNYELGLALCLMFQDKLDQSETVLRAILEERERRFGRFDVVSTL